MKKIALVTGGSSGIGKETARQLCKSGCKVYAAARRVEKMRDLEKEGIIPIFIDLTDDDSVKSCVDEIIKKEKRIDILVNNAGYGSYGAIEDVPVSEAKRQFEVNVFAMARLIQLTVPYMRKNGYGKIVNVASVAGKVWTSFGGWYSATKFAVEGLSDCLRMELKPFGIDVIVIEPGGIKTDWGIIAAQNLKKTSKGGAYAKAAAKTADNMTKMYLGNILSDPDKVAKTICTAVKAKHPKTRYMVGFMAKPMLVTKRVFGDRVYDFLIKKVW